MVAIIKIDPKSLPCHEGMEFHIVFPLENHVFPLLPPWKKVSANVLNLALVPRVSRAQKLDALTSMANIAGRYFCAHFNLEDDGR